MDIKEVIFASIPGEPKIWLKLDVRPVLKVS